MTTDTFLFNAGWLFFAAFLVVIAAVTITAFGRDLLPWTSHPHPDPTHKSPADQLRPNQVRPTQSSAR
jgi:hypothetical protein